MPDPYHPHYESIDKDYFQRLMDNARSMANGYRLMCYRYTAQEAEAIDRKWEEAKGKMK